MADLITNTDIAPNAGILGTQIADYTIQSRNIAPGALPASVIADGEVFKIVAEGFANVGAQSVGLGDVVLATIPHNLGYIPAYMAFTNFNHVSTGIWSAFPQITYSASAGAININIMYSSRIDATNLYIYGSSGQSQTTSSFDVHYYILQETAN